MRIKIKSSFGKYLSYRGAGDNIPLNAAAAEAGLTEEFDLIIDNLRVRTGDWAKLYTFNLIEGAENLARAHREFFTDGKYVINRDRLWRISTNLYLHDEVSEPTAQMFRIHRLNNDNRTLTNSDRIALMFGDQGFLSVDSAGLLTIVNRDAPRESETFIIETIRDLKLYWNNSRADNFSTATPQGELDAQQAGYQFERVQGRIYLNDGPGRKPLFLFWNSANADNLLVATEEGEREALNAGYTKVRLEGYVLQKSEPGTIPLRTYWRGADRKDYFSAANVEEERNAADAHYEFVRDEGYILPPRPPIPSLRLDPGLTLSQFPATSPQREAPAGAGIQLLPHDKHDPATIPSTIGNLAGIRIPEGVELQSPAIPALIHVNDISLPRSTRGDAKKALVLSGGGAKGSFEVGAVKYLWEQGYRPDIICGVSVGALNAAKLAEGLPSSATDLETIWRQLHPANKGGRAVYSRNYYVDLLLNWAGNMLVDFLDELTTADLMQWASYLISHLHSIHSMHPLRDLVRQNLNVSAIYRSGIKLRIGISDMQTGQYFSVTEPFAPNSLFLHLCGRIEAEPDHRMGETWLSRPIFGADSYAMMLEDAVIASSGLPVFMDPRILNLRTAWPVEWLGERIAMLFSTFGEVTSTYSPPDIQRIMRITQNGTRRDAGIFTELKNAHSPYYNIKKAESNSPIAGDSLQAHHHLFDGGLRDTMAIRTAIRLGAREIIVIAGDRLQAASWNYTNPAASDLPLPVAQYMFGLLGMWFNEVARTDMLLSVAHNEFLGWLYRCFSLLDTDKRKQILREFNDYWSTHGAILQRVLGGSTWIGGDVVRTYGTPFLDEGSSIKYIVPQADIVDAMGFDDWPNIDEAIRLGYEAAQAPVELSQPVPDDLVR